MLCRKNVIIFSILLVLLVIFANIHLVYISLNSAPECIHHLKTGDGISSYFAAAKSSC